MESLIQQFQHLGAEGSSPLSMAAVFVAFSLLPIMMLSMTSFIKISVVFSIFRSALGAQQVPSAAISAVLALILSLYVMAPVGRQAGVNAENAFARYNADPQSGISQVPLAALEPFEQFMRTHSRLRERLFFASRGHLSESPDCVHSDSGESIEACLSKYESIISLVPAFVLSQLSDAFLIGVLIYLPFLLVDVIVANILVGLGMMMLSPMIVSLPLKLALFVASDGWFLLSRSLLLSYAPGGS